MAWTGSLAGLTPSAAVVLGDAKVGVDLTTLTGDAHFINLETWPTGSEPGAAGSGAQWRDGDLSYTVSARGNTFIQTGGDDHGLVTGIFVGSGHEDMVGTLERDDLTAAFGGSR